LGMRILHRPQSFCPNAACESNRGSKRPRLATHGWIRTRTTRRRRRICKLCGTTVSKTHGTPYHRMHRPKGDLDRALHMSTEGMSASAIACVLRTSVSTITRWLEKAGHQAQAFSDEFGRVKDPVELQLDEIKSYGIGEAANARCFMGIEVWSRFWSALHVSKRTLRSLSINRPPRTPAMAAEIFDRPLSFRTILSWVPRPTGCLPLRKLVEWTTLSRKARGCSPVLNS
jgi:transposase-like protein